MADRTYGEGTYGSGTYGGSGATTRLVSRIVLQGRYAPSIVVQMVEA